MLLTASKFINKLEMKSVIIATLCKRFHKFYGITAIAKLNQSRLPIKEKENKHYKINSISKNKTKEFTFHRFRHSVKSER
ncbi:hypothetical protein C9J03_06555 [Photobacterium gaetbulicola]|nr:hypothetical protein C9J03_06555 [Photobacterium gaetbulicola]